MLIRLAIANVWRRLSRSTLTLLAMGVAAAVLTSGLSLSQGIMRLAFTEYRSYYGGDILVFSPGFVGATEINQESNAKIVRRVLHDSGFNPLPKLYNDFRTEGYLTEDGWQYKPLSKDWLQPDLGMGITGAIPYRVMPAYLGNKAVELKRSPVDIRPHIIEGSEPTISISGEIRAVVNTYGLPDVKVGDVIQVAVPQYKLDANGVPYSASDLEPGVYNVRIVGKAAWPTRTLVWSNDGVTLSEQGYVHMPELYLTETSWQEIWNRQAQGVEYPLLSVALKVKNLSELNVVQAKLQKEHPDLAVFAIPKVASHVERYSLLDRFYTAPAYLWLRNEIVQPYAPREFGLLSSVLLYLNAGMLLASQMLANVAARRKEIGILKAIGARRAEVVGMVLVEAVFLAMLGAVLGFSLVRAAGIYQAISNNLRLIDVLITTAREFVMVSSLTTLVSLVFGAIPAWRVARLTVMEVFRNE